MSVSWSLNTIQPTRPWKEVYGMKSVGLEVIVSILSVNQGALWRESVGVTTDCLQARMATPIHTAVTTHASFFFLSKATLISSSAMFVHWFCSSDIVLNNNVNFWRWGRVPQVPTPKLRTKVPPSLRGLSKACPVLPPACLSNPIVHPSALAEQNMASTMWKHNRESSY